MQIRELFNDFPLHGMHVIPLDLKRLLGEELNVTSDWSRAEHLLLDARSSLPRQHEIGVALYKMYAYSNRIADALSMIDQVLSAIADEEGLPSDWRQLDASDPMWRGVDGALQIYLYSLKAKGFVWLRAGLVEQAYAILDKLQSLDPHDQVGGSVVFELAEKISQED